MLTLLVHLAFAAAPVAPPPLVACAAASLPTTLDAAARLTALAAEDPSTISPWRAHTRTDVPIQLAPGVRAYPGNARPSTRVATVVASGSTVTLLLRDGPANLLLEVDPAVLTPLVTRPVALARAPGEPAAMHVDLTDGAEVQILASNADQTRIAWAGEHAQTTGWIPSDALGPIAAPCPLPDEVHDVELVVGGPALELRDAPNGAPVAWVVPGAEWMGRSLGKVRHKSGSWTALVWTEGPMRVAGYVPSARVRSTGLAHLYRTRHWADPVTGQPPAERAVSLPAGALLSADGIAFARLVEPATLALLDEHGATMRVRLTTAWGSLIGTVPCTSRTSGAGGVVCAP